MAAQPTKHKVMNVYADLKPYGQMGALAALLATGRRVTLAQRIHTLYAALGLEEPEISTSRAAAAALKRLRRTLKRYGIEVPDADRGPYSDGGLQLSKENAEKLRALLEEKIASHRAQAADTAALLREAADILTPGKD